MTQLSGFALLLLATAFLVETEAVGRSEVSVRVVPVAQVIRIPLASLADEKTPPVTGGDSPVLSYYPGAADELPEGPDGFDAFDDGSLLISDPLRDRVVAYDSQGKFRQSWNVGFAADSIEILSDGPVMVREAGTGLFHPFSREGKPMQDKVASAATSLEAQRLTPNSGSVTNGKGNQIPVRFNQPGRTLVSLENLAIDRSGQVYVALESTTGQATDSIDVAKTVRKYSADGSLLCETANLPLDYFITPVDELRVHQGKVYQLMTTSKEVQINVWNTN